MSQAVTVLETREADRRLLLKLQHRLLRTPPPAEEPVFEAEDRLPALIFSIAPMTLAFFYLIVLSFFLFR